MVGPQTAVQNTNKLGVMVIDVIFYHTLYSKCGEFSEEIKTALAGLESLRKTGTETPPIYDKKINAYTGSIEYLIQRRI
jgi:hypothetical protein